LCVEKEFDTNCSQNLLGCQAEKMQDWHLNVAKCEAVMNKPVVPSASAAISQVSSAASLTELNRRFLELVSQRLAAPSLDSFLGLPADLGPRLARLTRQERDAAAAGPFALFDVRFSDEAHWQLRLQSPIWQVADAPTTDRESAEFVRLAVFYAWHLAATRPLDAQLMLGMAAATAEALRAVTLDRLPGIAAAEQRYLAARWHERSRFWPALAEAAAAPGGPRLRRVQLHGLQLTAAARLPKAASYPRA
jgi:hypothetical protein